MGMLRYVALLLVALMLGLVSGCGAEDPDSEAAPVADVAESPSADAPPSTEGDGGFVPEYASATELLDALRSAGIRCDTEDEPAETAYAADGWFCFTNDTRDDGYEVAVYATGEQQGEALPYLTELNPGATYVVGAGWSVSVPSESDGSEVVDAVGGQVYE